MKIAVLTDIHSNLEALNACLAHARSQGAEQYAFLGDHTGYGADPNACLDIIASMVNTGALAVLGNHDEAVLGGLCENMAFRARDAIYWTRQQLQQPQRDFLQSLPLVAQDGKSFYAHASADFPERACRFRFCCVIASGLPSLDRWGSRVTGTPPQLTCYTTASVKPSLFSEYPTITGVPRVKSALPVCLKDWRIGLRQETE